MILQQSAEIVAKQQGWEKLSDNYYEHKADMQRTALAPLDYLVTHFTKPAELIRVRWEIMEQVSQANIPSEEKIELFDRLIVIGKLILNRAQHAALIKLAELITLIKKK
jgi:hypothetical protein